MLVEFHECSLNLLNGTAYSVPIMLPSLWRKGGDRQSSVSTDGFSWHETGPCHCLEEDTSGIKKSVAGQLLGELDSMEFFQS